MKYYIRVSLRKFDSDTPELLVDIHGASEETRNLIIEKYNGINFIIQSAQEEATFQEVQSDIESLDLSERPKRILLYNRLNVLKTIQLYNTGELWKLRNLGSKSYHEIEDKLLAQHLIGGKKKYERPGRKENQISN